MRSKLHHLQIQYGHDSYPAALVQVENQPALLKYWMTTLANPLARNAGVSTVSICVPTSCEVNNVCCDPNTLDAYNLSVETINSIINCQPEYAGRYVDVGVYLFTACGRWNSGSPKMENMLVRTTVLPSICDVAKLYRLSVEERAQDV